MDSSDYVVAHCCPYGIRGLDVLSLSLCLYDVCMLSGLHTTMA